MRFLSSALLVACSLGFGLVAHGEYRVFKLQITTPAAPAEPGQPPPQPTARSFESTLDPDQYRGYYPLKPGETITYTDTWRCRGRTDGLELCASPRSPASVVGPESASPAPAGK